MHDIDYRLVRDHGGEVAGQLQDHWVTDRHDRIIGCVFGTGLYTLDGTHIGWCEGDRVLDLEGGVVALVQRVRGQGAEVHAFPSARRPRVPVLKPRRPRRAAGGPSPHAFTALFAAPAAAIEAPDYPAGLLASRLSRGGTATR